MPNIAGMPSTAASVIPVPSSVGVTMRWIAAICGDSAICTMADTTSNVPSKPGPPASSASAQTAMNATEGPAMSAYPVPIRLDRLACRSVAIPDARRAANTAHVA